MGDCLELIAYMRIILRRRACMALKRTWRLKFMLLATPPYKPKKITKDANGMPA